MTSTEQEAIEETRLKFHCTSFYVGIATYGKQFFNIEKINFKTYQVNHMDKLFHF